MNTSTPTEARYKQQRVQAQIHDSEDVPSDTDVPLEDQLIFVTKNHEIITDSSEADLQGMAHSIKGPLKISHPYVAGETHVADILSQNSNRTTKNSSRTAKVHFVEERSSLEDLVEETFSRAGYEVFTHELDTMNEDEEDVPVRLSAVDRLRAQLEVPHPHPRRRLDPHSPPIENLKRLRDEKREGAGDGLTLRI